MFKNYAKRCYVYKEAVNMGRSFNGLSSLVEDEMHRKVASGDMFIFFNRRVNYLKILWNDGTGICLFSKRLPSGQFEVPEAQRISLEAMQSIVDCVMDSDEREVERLAA